MVMGRPFTDEDTATIRTVAVINEAFARRFFKNENPLDRSAARTKSAHSAHRKPIPLLHDNPLKASHGGYERLLRVGKAVAWVIRWRGCEYRRVRKKHAQRAPVRRAIE
jgi:hypothetical protein